MINPKPQAQFPAMWCTVDSLLRMELGGSVAENQSSEPSFSRLTLLPNPSITTRGLLGGFLRLLRLCDYLCLLDHLKLIVVLTAAVAVFQQHRGLHEIDSNGL